MNQFFLRFHNNYIGASYLSKTLVVISKYFGQSLLVSNGFEKKNLYFIFMEPWTTQVNTKYKSFCAKYIMYSVYSSSFFHRSFLPPGKVLRHGIFILVKMRNEPRHFNFIAFSYNISQSLSKAPYDGWSFIFFFAQG